MLRSPKFARRSRRDAEHGYILLTLMFIATLVILSLTALSLQIKQQIQRDQEEELIHRGVQYARAIQHFYKKTGRYPVSLDELDNFNNVRFLRKHYKDPITGKDFKLLHYGEIQTMFGAGAGIPGAVAAANAGNTLGGMNPQTGMLAQAALNQGTPFAQGQMNMQSSSPMQPLGATNPPGANPTDASASQSASGQQSQGNDTESSSGSSGSSSSSSAFGAPGQQLGGGPIVGVASTSKKKSIREFNKKNHYKDWQFIYDPSSDRGGLLNTPAQPNLNVSINASGQGNQQTGSGQGTGMGSPSQPSGTFGQQPNSFGQQGMPMPNQPPDQMQQEQ